MKTHNYTTATYTVSIDVTKSPESVFHHLTHDVDKFWPEDLAGACSKLNDEFKFTIDDSHYSRNKVIELLPNEKIVWLVTDSLRKSDNYEWTGTKMIFELTPKGNNTIIAFTYDGPVLEEEYERLVHVCDMVIKEMLYNFIMKTSKSFSTTILLSKPVNEVFRCITDVPHWWNRDDFNGNSKQLHDEFIIHHPCRHYSKQRVVEVVPNRKFVWLVTDSTLYWLQRDKHEWTNTKMIFEITASGDKTVVQFTHDGLVPEKECYAMCEEGWTMVITKQLVEFVEKGKSI